MQRILKKRFAETLEAYAGHELAAAIKAAARAPIRHLDVDRALRRLEVVLTDGPLGNPIDPQAPVNLALDAVYEALEEHGYLPADAAE
jgi:hypothetical protein